MTDDLTNYDRRMTIHREDGSSLSYSIPAGVTDSQAAEEVTKMEQLIALGYSYELDFHDDGPVWIEYLLRTRDKIGFWFKCRWLDVYWFVRGPAAKARRINVS